MSTDGNPVQTVEFGMITYPGAVADLHLPGKGHPRGRAKQHLPPNLRTEKAKESSSPTVERLRREAKQGCLHQLPQQYHEAIASPEAWRNAKPFQILKFMRRHK